MKMIKWVGMFCLVCTLVACGGESYENDTKDQIEPKQEEVKREKIGIHQAEITIQNYGVIILELDGDTAPVTVQNFIDLAKEGFYDGLTFHRIISGFMIQGGDPNGNGSGGSSKNITGEFSDNGIENNISHVRGTLSMARSQANDSASSQFFIVHEDSLFLDGNYAGFGKVTSGMEIVDAICSNATPIDDNGSIDQAQQPIIESVKIIE